MLSHEVYFHCLFFLQAFGPIGAMFGGLVAWPVSDKLGRQAALMLGGVPALIGWLMITYSNLAETSQAFLGVLYFGRILTGFSTGWCIFCVSVSALSVLQGNPSLLLLLYTGVHC